MTDGEQFEDASLVERILGGDQRAVAMLISRHREAVFRFARHYTSDPEDALDLTQETFASALIAIRRYDRARRFRTWIMHIAANKCHDWSRRRAVRRFLFQAVPIEDAPEVASAAPTPEVAAQDALELKRVSAAIARLPDPLRQVLILRAIEDLSQLETAQILGLSEKAVETRLRRARRRLHELLA